MKKMARQTQTISKGYLKAKYSASDGYYWNNMAYAKFAEKVEKFDKALDR